jgi:hypothetical protein
VPCVITHWKVDQLEGLTHAAEQARDRLFKRMARIKKIADRLNRKREEATAAA